MLRSQEDAGMAKLNEYEISMKLLEQLTDRVDGKLYFNRYLHCDSGLVIDIGEDAYLTKLGSYYNDSRDLDVPNGTEIMMYIPAGYDDYERQEAQQEGNGFNAYLTLVEDNILEGCEYPIVGVEINGEVYIMNYLSLYLPDMHILTDAEIDQLKCYVVAELI